MNNILIVNDRIIDEDPLKILRDIQVSCHNGKLASFKISGTGISVPCPVHSEGTEKHNSCYINLKDEDVPYLWFHCFTCQATGPFEKFVGECFDKSEEWGANWLISHYATDFANEEIILDDIVLEDEHENVETFLDETILDTFESYHPYMTQRKLSDEVIKEYKIKYDSKTKCLVFPVFDLKNRLKFLTRRSVINKKFIIDEGVSKKTIYLLNDAINKGCREVIVCESQLNALTSLSYGKQAIALFGAGTTKEQINELNKSDINSFILMYDGDSAGRSGAEKFKKLISKTKFVTDIIMPTGKDVNDLTKEEFYNLLKENGVE